MMDYRYLLDIEDNEDDSEDIDLSNFFIVHKTRKKHLHYTYNYHII
jgi:hypothetical protein